MKSIPVALQSHLNLDATTLCMLTRVQTKDGTVYGFTDLDVNVVYNDGAGSVTYRADNGFTPSRLQASADLAVDNAELSGVVMDTGITEAQIRAGLFDHAKVKVYRVNYMDLSQGHEVVATGTAGETTFSANGWKTEFRSLTQHLKQPVSDLYSLTCPKRFGSKAIGTNDGSYEERFPCGKSFTWTNGTITAVGANARLTFTDSALTQADNYFVLGVVEITSGPNLGAQMEVFTHASDTITLALPLPYALTVGTTYRVRKDCNKIHDDVNNGCKFHFGADWINHFGGQPDIPVSDNGKNMVPGAQIDRA